MQEKIVNQDFIGKSILSDIKLRWIIVLIGGTFFIGYVFLVHIQFLFLTVAIVILSILFNIIMNVCYKYFLLHPIFYSYITGFFVKSAVSVFKERHFYPVALTAFFVFGKFFEYGP